MRIFTHYGRASGYQPDFPKASVLGQLEQSAITQAMAPIPCWYGVATGNGNDGVSHSWPNFYIWTNDPWAAAERYAQSLLKPAYHDEIEVDGEADYTVSAYIYGEEYCPLIVEVYRATPEGTAWRYGSLSEAFGELGK